MKRKVIHDWRVAVPGMEPFMVRASERKVRFYARNELANRHWVKTGKVSTARSLPRGTKIERNDRG